MIRFDIDERYLDEAEVGTAISRPESAMLSVGLHGLLLAAILFAPALPMFQPSAEELQRREAEQAVAAARQKENRTFVFVKPKSELQAVRPPERGQLSDLDRLAQSPPAPVETTDPLPFARGSTPDPVEETRLLRGVPDQPPALEALPGMAAQGETRTPLPEAETGYSPPLALGLPLSGGSPLGDALRNLDRYVQGETFDNPQGGAGQPGAAIQFDAKGVEFGPWIRRFVGQVKRNWFVPNAAWLLKGRVVLQFNIHKDGHVTDISVVAPSEVVAFNNAAYNAILTSNPTEPLPPEYPADKALFTVTFYYNEAPLN